MPEESNPAHRDSISDFHTNENFSRLTRAEAEIIKEISLVYTGLEYIITHDSNSLDGAGKMKIRRAQAQVQKIRLRLLDLFDQRRQNTIPTDHAD